MDFSRYFELIFLAVLVIILLLVMIWTILNGISPMPTMGKTKRMLLQALPASVDGPITDLGSGWGTLVRALAKKYPNTTVIGYETSPIPYLVSKCLSLTCKNLSIKRVDFFTVNLKPFSLIVCYLYPQAMKRLEKKLQSECEKKTLIITHTFSFSALQPEKSIQVNDLFNTKIYFFRIG
jgi:hypothetical protein